MVRVPTLVVPCKPCDKTASAALMKGWISSIFMELGSCSGRTGNGSVIAQNVLDHFVQYFRLHRLLHEMARAPLQRGDDVFLVSDRRNHHNARLRMLLDNPFGSLNSFHLRHGDIHEHDVGMSAVELADGSQAVPGFSCHLPAKAFNHAGKILAGKHGVVHDQVANRLSVLAAFYRCKLLHTTSSFSVNPLRQTTLFQTTLTSSHATAYHAWLVPHQITLVTGNGPLPDPHLPVFPARCARPVDPTFDPPLGRAVRPQIACSSAPIPSNPTTRMA